MLSLDRFYDHRRLMDNIANVRVVYGFRRVHKNHISATCGNMAWMHRRVVSMRANTRVALYAALLVLFEALLLSEPSLGLYIDFTTSGLC